MRRSMKKLCCAILCICLLLINVPDSVSYAENMEQNATYTDADTDTTTENADVSVVKEIAQPATATDAEDIDTEAATAGDVLLSATAMVEDELLYAASDDESGGRIDLRLIPKPIGTTCLPIQGVMAVDGLTQVGRQHTSKIKIR